MCRFSLKIGSYFYKDIEEIDEHNLEITLSDGKDEQKAFAYLLQGGENPLYTIYHNIDITA